MRRELAPAATSFALLFNPTNPIGQAGLGYAQAAARQLGTKILLNASSEAEIDAAFASLARTGAVALVVMPDSFLITRRNQIASLAAGHKIPIISPLRDSAQACAHWLRSAPQSITKYSDAD
jgi:putative ABC transport system substrate-binding protein